MIKIAITYIQQLTVVFVIFSDDYSSKLGCTFCINQNAHMTVTKAISKVSKYNPITVKINNKLYHHHHVRNIFTINNKL